MDDSYIAPFIPAVTVVPDDAVRKERPEREEPRRAVQEDPIDNDATGRGPAYGGRGDRGHRAISVSRTRKRRMYTIVTAMVSTRINVANAAAMCSFRLL